ncbi:MAG: hypothetical protein KatS3mg031_0648 [Chitinophagales bacterium]|nr:MAG: hypothetical protein KatS3mg031_0648 [Chitinophagales bacterium]
MQFLYFLLILFLIISAIIALLMAAGILHIEVYVDKKSEDFSDETEHSDEEKNEE